MGVTYRFLAIDSEYQRVIDWFSDRPERPTVVGTDSGVNIHFSAFGPLARTTAGQVDTKRSPLVNVFLPQLKRGILWTAGEIHILATPLKKQYPPLQRVSAALREWLREFGRVHPPVAPENWNYYLEGSIRNYDSEIFALPAALHRLRCGDANFVSRNDGDGVLDRLCLSLRLRGQQCGGVGA